MLRLLRSDLYRLFRSKAFYICTGIATFLVVISIIIMNWSYGVISSNNAGTVTVSIPFKDGISYGLSIFSGGDVHLFMAIFIAVFITADFTHGTMKNVVSKGFDRLKIYLSKYVTMMIASFLMLLVLFLASTISGTVVLGSFGDFTGVLVGQMLRMIVIELLLHAALTAVFVMVAMAVRNIGGAIAINIGITMFSTMIYQLIDMLSRNKTHFVDYGLRKNITMYMNNMAPPNDDILRSIIVAVVFLAVTLAAGMAVFKNTDVK